MSPAQSNQSENCCQISHIPSILQSSADCWHLQAIYSKLVSHVRLQQFVLSLTPHSYLFSQLRLEQTFIGPDIYITRDSQNCQYWLSISSLTFDVTFEVTFLSLFMQLLISILVSLSMSLLMLLLITLLM